LCSGASLAAAACRLQGLPPCRYSHSSREGVLTRLLAGATGDQAECTRGPLLPARLQAARYAPFSALQAPRNKLDCWVNCKAAWSIVDQTCLLGRLQGPCLQLQQGWLAGAPRGPCLKFQQGWLAGSPRGALLTITTRLACRNPQGTLLEISTRLACRSPQGTLLAITTRLACRSPQGTLLEITTRLACRSPQGTLLEMSTRLACRKPKGGAAYNCSHPASPCWHPPCGPTMLA
jgi:hypothetical protein